MSESLERSESGMDFEESMELSGSSSFTQEDRLNILYILRQVMESVKELGFPAVVKVELSDLASAE